MSVHSSYRSDIDGLRAIAVIPVVLFHAGVPGLEGGYIGVDVFFVISGFLITSILQKSLDADRFSIFEFYERRIRRILPALFAMLALTFIAGILLLLPLEMERLGQSIIATSLFASNFFFWRQSGYFDPGAGTQPLLHTWSLAVEEQFYIFFPLALWFVNKWAKKLILPVLVGLAVASFLICVLLIGTAAGATFYLLPTRAWELLIGSVVAVVPRLSGKWAGPVAWTGLAAIIVPVFVYNSNTVFPGYAALPPTLGAAAILWAAARTRVGTLLSLPPIRGLGLISYSLYLWHWPPLVFAGLTFGLGMNGWISAGCVLFALIAAVLSWRYIEQPFRRTRTTTTKGPILAAVATIAVFLFVGAFAATGMRFRVPDEVALLADVSIRPESTVPECTSNEGCAYSKGIAIWGDSHAGHLENAVRSLTEPSGFKTTLFGRGGCAPTLDTGFDRSCSAFNKKTIDAILQDKNIQIVIIAGRWSRFIFPKSDNESMRLTQSGAPQDELAAIAASWEKTTHLLKNAEKHVILVGSVPEFLTPLPECLARAKWRNTSEDRCAYRPETLPGTDLQATLRQFASTVPSVEVVDPLSLFCNAANCSRFINGIPTTFDEDHLTSEAAMALMSTSSLTVQTLSDR